MSAKQVSLIGAFGEPVVDLGPQDDIFKKMTIEELRIKIYSTYGTGVLNDANDLRLWFAAKELRNTSPNGDVFFLDDYGIKKNSVLQVVLRVLGGNDDKEYDPEKHFGLKFTTKPDEILGYDENDEGKLRVEMSCGHATAADSLTQWCRSLIDQGKIKFHCPALVDEKTNKLCRKEWDYTEVRRIALLNEEEMRYFERLLSYNAAPQYCEFKECPECRSYLERKDKQNLRANCPLCTKTMKRTYDFCWTCSREWQGSKWMEVSTCGRSDCMHPQYPSIRDAPWVDLPDVKMGGKKVPIRRACPTCGYVEEHSLKGCKFLDCKACYKSFCFICLRTQSACLSRGSGHFEMCVDGVTPKQTSIPVRSREPESEPESEPRQEDESCTIL